MKKDENSILKLHENDDSSFYYLENGAIVFTPDYHIKRSECCGSKCRHCPYEPLHVKGNSQLQDIYIKK
jgi:hypothetical protein